MGGIYKQFRQLLHMSCSEKNLHKTVSEDRSISMSHNLLMIIEVISGTQHEVRDQILMTLSANCMAVTMSSILVVSPTSFLSKISKWVRHVPQTRI